MTDEPPVPPGRRPRPDAAFRREALSVDPPAPGAVPPSRGGTPPARPSLAEELARIPDLEPGAPVPPTEAPAPPPRVAVHPKPAKVRKPSATSAPPEVGPLPPQLAHVAPPKRPSAFARTVFSLALVGLILAVPVLGVYGYRLVARSTDGEFAGRAPTPRDPGYEAAVEPTPTALVLQHDATGRPVAATFMSLSGENGGGSMIFVPLETALRKPALGIDRLMKAYDTLSAKPAEGRRLLATQVSHLLNVGIDETIEVDDKTWAQLTTPVGAIPLENPDEVTLADGTVLPAGPITLTPLQVGPYLAATVDGESDLNRLNRQQVFWQAWFDAIAKAGLDTAVPGETSSGMGLFARTLASGPITSDVLPVTQDEVDPTLLRMDTAAANAMVTAAVPAPVAAYYDSRQAVRVLNGVSASPIPPEILSKIVSLNGEVAIVGNGPAFGQAQTTIVYGDPEDRDYAKIVQAALGGGAKLRLDREAPDTLDLTVVLGKDLLGADGKGTGLSTTTSSTLPGATLPGSTLPGAGDLTTTSQGF